MLFKILYLVMVSFFFAAFIFNFILNLIQDSKAKSALKSNPQHMKGRIRDIQQVKGRVYLCVEFTSQHNRLLLSETFELTESDIKIEEYQIGQEVDLIFNDVSAQKKVKYFPLQLANLKVKLDHSLLFINIALIVLGGFVFVNTLFTYIKFGAFTTDIPLTGENGLFTNNFYILLMIVIYFVLSSYLVSSLVDVPRKDLQNYLKVYGNCTKARVVTYKFSRAKNANGTKESQLEIEFRTNKGDEVKAKLNSFLYTETQEEYIDIIYDPKEPRNVVYVRQ